MANLRKKMPTVAEVEAALHECKGTVSVVARRLGVSRKWVYTKIHASERLQQALVETREEECDVAELQLARILRDTEHPKQFDAIKYVLETHGRSRGYGAPVRHEVTADVSARVEVVPVLARIPDNARVIDVGSSDD